MGHIPRCGTISAPMPRECRAPQPGGCSVSEPYRQCPFMSVLPFNWIDLAVVAVIAIGVTRGRKRGMSEELLDVIKWVMILFACSQLYEPLGSLLATASVFSLL